MATKTYEKADHSGLLEDLTSGIEKLTTSNEWASYLKAQATFHNYSFQNVTLVLMQKPDATQVAGFGTWKKLGRYPRKGTGIYILAPMIRKVEKEVTAVTPKGEVLGTESETTKAIFGFKWVCVFDVSDTDGDDLPEAPAKLLTGDDVDGLFASLSEYARAELKVTTNVVTEGLGSANGNYDPATLTIRVKGSNSALQQVKTLAHELAHAHLHNDLSEYAANRGRCELEAESVAFVVCSALGLDISDYSFGYVATWAGGGEEAVATIKGSAQRIQKTAASILKCFESAPVVEGS